MRTLDGFLAGFPPMRAAKARAALDRTIRSDGRYSTRGRLVEDKVVGGARVTIREGERALETPGVGWILESDISKTAIDYAAFLVGPA